MGHLKKIQKDHAFIYFCHALAFMITDQKANGFNRGFIATKWGWSLSGYIAVNIVINQQVVKLWLFVRNYVKCFGRNKKWMEHGSSQVMGNPTGTPTWT